MPRLDEARDGFESYDRYLHTSRTDSLFFCLLSSRFSSLLLPRRHYIYMLFLVHFYASTFNSFGFRSLCIAVWNCAFAQMKWKQSFLCTCSSFEIKSDLLDRVEKLRKHWWSNCFSRHGKSWGSEKSHDLKRPQNRVSHGDFNIYL